MAGGIGKVGGTDADGAREQSVADTAPRGDNPLKIAIVTMAYNEGLNLPIWCAHYRRVARNAELFVIDHGTDDGSTSGLAEINRIKLPRGEMDEITRARFVCMLQASLLNYYDFVIYTDCDELITVDPTVLPSLEDYLLFCDYEYASPIGLNMQHIVGVEPPLVDGVPMLSQRSYCYFQSNMCKPLISRIPLKWEAGFHYSDKRLNIDTNLYLFHTKKIDYDRAALRHQTILRQVKWSQRAIDANHSGHHRFSEDRFVRDSFTVPANAFRRDGVGPFVFKDEIARLKAEAEIRGPGRSVPIIRGPLVKIPDRFKKLF